jgi:hypothetical protein
VRIDVEYADCCMLPRLLLSYEILKKKENVTTPVGILWQSGSIRVSGNTTTNKRLDILKKRVEIFGTRAPILLV